MAAPSTGKKTPKGPRYTKLGALAAEQGLELPDSAAGDGEGAKARSGWSPNERHFRLLFRAGACDLRRTTHQSFTSIHITNELTRR